jgi:hypothetical protein
LAETVVSGRQFTMFKMVEAAGIEIVSEEK